MNRESIFGNHQNFFLNSKLGLAKYNHELSNNIYFKS
jgi:hypothetical protein